MISDKTIILPQAAKQRKVHDIIKHDEKSIIGVLPIYLYSIVTAVPVTVTISMLPEAPTVS